MPAFNCAPFIRKAIESILGQEYGNLELLICDDGSSDDTWSIINEYGKKDNRVRAYKNENNSGVVYTRNYLFSKAAGDLFATQDADDWSEISRLKLQVRHFIDDPQLGACGTACIRVDNQGRTHVPATKPDVYMRMEDCSDTSFWPGSIMIRKEVYRSVGGLSTFFSRSISEDLYWIVRIAGTFKLLFIGTPLYYNRFNAQSITNTFDRKEKLVAVDLIKVLIRQRIETGTDWVESNDINSIERFCKNKFSDRKWLSEKYRTMAAVQRDGDKRMIALRLILKALVLRPASVRNYATLRYVLF